MVSYGTQTTTVGYMAHILRPIGFEEFASHLDQIFTQLDDLGEPVLIERDGATYRLERDSSQAQDIWAGYDAAKVRAATRRVAGILEGVNRDELLADLHAQRGQDSPGRPA